MSRSPLQVFKFGGTSVATPEALRLAFARIREAAPRVVVVVSAMSGVTDLLLDAARSARTGDGERSREAAKSFLARHRDLVAALITRLPVRAELDAMLEASAAELTSICDSVAVLRELTPRTLDAAAARGERMMARIFTAYLVERGVPASYVDAADVIFTERRHDALWPDLPRCEQAAKKTLQPALDKGRVPVMPGFIGRGPDGEVATLGRGGTDFSASIAAAIVDADSVTLFKDVDGLMTADPKAVPDARVLPELHYREAAELAYYGAKVLHPRTMVPLAQKRIPLFIKNSFNPGFSGTRVAHDVEAGSYPVKALTAVQAQALVSVEGSGMMGVPGIAARTFVALSKAGHSVSMISQASSEASICFVVPQSESDDAQSALQREFAEELESGLIDRVRVQRPVALVAVVGLGMAGRPGIAARATAPLSREKVNILAMAQGSSELNITIAMDQKDCARGLKALHQEFQLERLRPLPETHGRAASVAIFGLGQIGRALARQLMTQERYFRHDLGLEIRCVAACDRTGVKANEAGFDDEALEGLCAQKEKGCSLFPRQKPLDLAGIGEMLRTELFPLGLHRPVFVDATAQDDAALILEALQKGFHVALANKKPLAAPQAEFDALLATAREKGVSLRYEATVGAGLPVLDTLAKLKEAGDEVETVLGCLSGTLGYLMTALEEGVSFSEAVRAAHKLGYTEPDPKDDLSGMDVARKALIVARTIGQKLNLSDVAVEPLFPKELASLTAQEFLARVGELDAEFARRVEAAREKKQVLRYVARIGGGELRVGLESVPEGSPIGRLRGLDNQVVLFTSRYKLNPLVVTGPGAGAEVTAAGVLNDIVAIASRQESRR